MKLRKVDPKSIKVPEVRVTARFDPEIEEQFKASMKGMGQVAPVLCCQVGEELVLVDGLHRLQEAIANGVRVVDVAVVEGDMVDVLTKNIFVDHLRGKTPPSEMVTVIEALTKEYGMDSEKIAARTGLSRDYVEKLQSIAELTPFCRAALDEGRINVGQAQALTRLKDPAKQETVLSQCLMYHWPTKELNAYITDVLVLIPQETEPGPVQEPLPPPKLRCAFCRGEYELGQIANPNVCAECAGVMFASIAEAKRQIEAEKRAPQGPL